MSASSSNKPDFKEKARTIVDQLHDEDGCLKHLGATDVYHLELSLQKALADAFAAGQQHRASHPSEPSEEEIKNAAIGHADWDFAQDHFIAGIRWLTQRRDEKIAQLEAEVKRLREFEFMYKELCKQHKGEW